MRIASPSADVLLTAGDNAAGPADDAADGDLFARLLQGEPTSAVPTAEATATATVTMMKSGKRTLDLMPTPVRTAKVEKDATASAEDSLTTAVVAAAVNAGAVKSVTAISSMASEPGTTVLVSSATENADPVLTAAQTEKSGVDEDANLAQRSRLTAGIQATTIERDKKPEKSPTTSASSRRVVIEPSMGRNTRVIASTQRDDDEEQDHLEPDAPSAKPAVDATPSTLAQGTPVAPAPTLTVSPLPPSASATESNAPTTAEPAATDAAPGLNTARQPTASRRDHAALMLTRDSGKSGGNSGKELPSPTATDAVTADNMESAQAGNSSASAPQNTATAGFQSLLANQTQAWSAAAPADNSNAAQAQGLATTTGNTTTAAAANNNAAASNSTSTTNGPLFNATYAMDSNGFGAETVHHIRWLKDHDLHSAELQLHPAELGRLSISIDIREGQASVQLVANTTEARELLERSLPELRQMLAQNGMTLGDSQVSQQQAHQQQRDGRGLRQLPEFFNMSDMPMQELTPRPARFRASGGSHRIDHYV